MKDYLEEMRYTAENPGETSDRITLEPLPIMKKDPYPHTMVALEATGFIQFWDTTTLFAWILENNKHPLLQRQLSSVEKAYIKHYYLALTLEQEQDISAQDVYKDFIRRDGNLPVQDLMLARTALNPCHFADHFKDYQPIPDNIRYERAQAKASLKRSSTGSWLLRHSSLNRPADPNHQALINKLGLQFYAISYKEYDLENGRTIEHALILHRPGRGWVRITNVAYTIDTVKPEYTGETGYYPCFLDILLATIRQCNLHFINHVSGYL